MLQGGRRRFPSIPEAQAFLEEHKADPLLGQVMARALVGEARSVRAGIRAKAQAAGADEIFLMAVGPTLESRIRSLELTRPPVTAN
jgi:hypothetical protein